MLWMVVYSCQTLSFPECDILNFKEAGTVFHLGSSGRIDISTSFYQRGGFS